MLLHDPQETTVHEASTKALAVGGVLRFCFQQFNLLQPKLEPSSTSFDLVYCFSFVQSCCCLHFVLCLDIYTLSIYFAVQHGTGADLDLHYQSLMNQNVLKGHWVIPSKILMCKKQHIQTPAQLVDWPVCFLLQTYIVHMFNCCY